MSSRLQRLECDTAWINRWHHNDTDIVQYQKNYSLCLDIDPPAPLSGECQNKSRFSFKMFCPAFQTGNLCQVNINECASSPCMNKGTCVDGVASFTCLCELPYSGPTCAEVLTPCSPNPCANHAACTHTPDYLGYQCNCQPGWQGRQLLYLPS